eukprot:scaffold44307_cov69-Phaeocystis_antarctica.AAC.2
MIAGLTPRRSGTPYAHVKLIHDSEGRTGRLEPLDGIGQPHLHHLQPHLRGGRHERGRPHLERHAERRQRVDQPSNPQRARARRVRLRHRAEVPHHAVELPRRSLAPAVAHELLPLVDQHPEPFRAREQCVGHGLVGRVQADPAHLGLATEPTRSLVVANVDDLAQPIRLQHHLEVAVVSLLGSQQLHPYAVCAE